MTLPVIIVGSGGHASVVADALIASGFEVLGFTDKDVSRHGCKLCGLQVLGDDAILDSYTPNTVFLANGIGSVSRTQSAPLRHVVQQRLAAHGWHFIAVRHPSSVVSPYAQIGEGAQLMACSVVQPGAIINSGCIVNTAAVIEHDTILSACVHVAPGALICGNVIVGMFSHIGAGAIVRQGLRLGENTWVGAGAVVVRDFAGEGLLIGCPAGLAEIKT